MAILKVEKLEIEIQEQTMHKPGSKYFVLIKSENEEELKELIKKKKIYSSFLVLTKDIATSKYFSKQNKCKIIESKYPKWVYSINPKKIRNITLFQCNNFK